MRGDTSGMMEDALLEDRMMDCEGDEGGGTLEDLVDLATDITNSSSTIRDAAERLLTLLGVEDVHHDGLLSSSEDEGVELDVDEDSDDMAFPEDSKNTRLLHQLAASLAQELKYAQQQKQNPPSTTSLRVYDTRDSSLQGMDMSQDDIENHNYEDDKTPISTTTHSFHYFTQDSNNYHDKQPSTMESLEKLTCLDYRLRITEDREESSLEQQECDSVSWSAGWDACATEALRYLIEDEGLSPHHPTVLAMKNHLDLQRERFFAQYAV